MRRYLPFLVAALVLGFIGLIHYAVDLCTQEPPNYSLIDDGLYMGGYVKHPPPGTTVVLNVCETADPYQSKIHSWESIHDGAPAPSIEWLTRQVDFVYEHRRQGKTVYVHCRNGASRSALVVTAYLMCRYHWSRDQALEFVRSRRPVARPNWAFMELLADWENARQRG